MELAREALDVQNASNLSWVVHGFSRAITELMARLNEVQDSRSDFTFNEHPICILWADKIAHLTGTESCEHVHDGVDSISRAYQWVRDLVGGK